MRRTVISALLPLALTLTALMGSSGALQAGGVAASLSTVSTVQTPSVPEVSASTPATGTSSHQSVALPSTPTSLSTTQVCNPITGICVGGGGGAGGCSTQNQQVSCQGTNGDGNAQIPNCSTSNPVCTALASGAGASVSFTTNPPSSWTTSGVFQSCSITTSPIAIFGTNCSITFHS